MRPQRRCHTTRTRGAPKDWDPKTHGPCAGLPITDSEGVMYSYWQPTWWERWAILFGATIRLSVVGTDHPPVSLDLED